MKDLPPMGGVVLGNAKASDRSVILAGEDELVAGADMRSPPAHAKNYKLLVEFQTAARSLIEAEEQPGGANVADLQKHVAWFKELLA